MMKKKFKRILWIGFACFAALMILLPDNASLQVKPPRIGNIIPMEVCKRESNPKMESVLYQLMRTYFAFGIEEAKEFAEQRGIDMQGDLVRVVAEARTTGLSEESGERAYKRIFRYWQLQRQNKDFQTSASNLVRMQIRAFGGRVEAAYRHLVQSVVPLYTLQDLADFHSVKYLRLPKKPIPFVVSEGVEITGADLWQSVDPYRSEGTVKVCILDVGFSGYQSLLGTELPSSVSTRSFRADEDLLVSDHGTPCAEVVHDMAPDAELLLVNFGTEVEHHLAVNWIINQDVDIISCSIGWFNLGPGDGTGPICDDVEKAYDNGIIWVNAAGNNAETHWEGTFNDPDDDTWCNFAAPGDPENEWFEFYVTAGEFYSVFLNWDDWGVWDGSSYIYSEGNDYDLFLYDSAGVPIDWSMNFQRTGAPPEESVGFQAAYTGLCYIRIINFLTTRDCDLEMFFNNIDSIDTQYQEPSGSLAIPGDSPYAVAVGATYWPDDTYQSYSSQGPTSDGRVKPDLSAPVGVATSTGDPSGFSGTSAATPHVAGAFALLKGKTPFTLEQINEILEARAVDLGSTGKDSRFGYGRLRLSNGAGNGVQLRQVKTTGIKTMTSQGKKKAFRTKVSVKKKKEKKELKKNIRFN